MAPKSDVVWYDKNGKPFQPGDVVCGPDGVPFVVRGGSSIFYSSVTTFRFHEASQVTVCPGATVPEPSGPSGIGTIIWGK
jgi:hypothetical protein